jgi:hypothetical protein
MTNFREKFYNLLGGMFIGDSDIEGQGCYNIIKLKYEQKRAYTTN